MIGIIDYGLGNVASVAGAVEKLGFTACISAEEDDLSRAEKLILPGVGAFGDGMRELKSRGLVDSLNRLVLEEKKPILGICLGFQLIAKSSEEFGQHEGLGWVDAHVKRLEPADETLRLPHVGWNDLIQSAPSPLFEGIPEEALFYYVHSFHLVTDRREIIKGECDYGGHFVSVLEQGNIHATQFHPEKSQRHGLRLLQNFLEKG